MAERNLSVPLSTSQLRLAADAAIDLHLHTTYSDGTWTPEALLDYLVQERFALVAITDHDRADTAAVLQPLAAAKGLPVLVGVEMSTQWQGEMTDLLCYGFEPGDSPLNALAQDLARRQSANTQAVYERLLQAGHRLPPPAEGLSALLEKPSAQQPHALVAFLESLGVGDEAGALSAGAIAVEAGCMFALTDLAVVVEAAHQSGAVCLIAHPGRGDGFANYDGPQLDVLRQTVPIDGLEAYHPVHTPQQTALYLAYAQQHNLLISSGSDSHGSAKRPLRYPAELSRRLLERVGIQVEP